MNADPTVVNMVSEYINLYFLICKTVSFAVKKC